MTKTYKSVLKSSLVMLVLFAVAGSGVAQAQQCIARATGATTARAEGITEAVGSIELLCGTPPGFGFGVADIIKISIELNTQVTNQITITDRIIDADASALTYMGDGTVLGGTTAFRGEGGKKEVLSEDGTTISWEINEDELEFSADGNSVIIGGIRANASMLGDGGEVTAVVRVGGAAVHSGSLKLADVKTGLEITVTAAEGIQCESKDVETAMITIKEAIMAGISDNEAADAAADAELDDGLVLDFLNIPEGVTVTVPNMVINEPMIVDPETPTEMIIDPAAFSLMLVTGRTVGVTPNEDDDTKSDVELSPSGSGSARYIVTDVDDMVDGEWVTVPVDFKWTAGNVIDMGVVDVSLHPVSTSGQANFDDETTPTPRFVETNNPMTVISVSPCRTTLLFPYVTTKAGFDTGLVITNASEQDGTCAIMYSGSDAPDDLTPDPVTSGEQWIALLSGIAPGFQGYITATCEFQGGHGVAFLTDGDVAQGYLAVCISDICPGD